MAGEMHLRIWDVEHGACAMLWHDGVGGPGRLAMIDSGCTAEWRPSEHIKNVLGRNRLDYLFITNADQDHMSDLDGLWDEGVAVSVLHRNKNPDAATLREIKKKDGISNDIERFLKIHAEYNVPVTEPFNQYMGGITCRTFGNTYPKFSDTNNLSQVVFIRFGHFSIVFPGDLAREGWLELLKKSEFREELGKVKVFVASHHGREDGYCEEVFEYCTPEVFVMSDKAIVHDTQGMTQTYRQIVKKNHIVGVFVETTYKLRHVLTTRRDGWINFVVNEDGSFSITTEYKG